MQILVGKAAPRHHGLVFDKVIDEDSGQYFRSLSAVLPDYSEYGVDELDVLDGLGKVAGGKSRPCALSIVPLLWITLASFENLVENLAEPALRRTRSAVPASSLRSPTRCRGSQVNTKAAASPTRTSVFLYACKSSWAKPCLVISVKFSTRFSTKFRVSGFRNFVDGIGDEVCDHVSPAVLKPAFLTAARSTDAPNLHPASRDFTLTIPRHNRRVEGRRRP